MLFNMVLPRKVNKGRLPVGYQEVEYIQSSGTQCINTEYKPTSENFKVVYDFEYPSSDTTGSLFGSATPRGPYSIVAYNALSFYVGTSGALLPQTVTIQTRYSLAAQAKNNVLSVSLNGNTQTKAYNGSIFKTHSLHLFSSSNLGTAYQFCTIKLYACQIYDNDILVRDYVPCYQISSGTIGLYDLVNGVFYTNAGSGSFTIGADKI